MRGEVYRYLVAGTLAFLADLATLYACTEFLGMHYLVSNIFGYFVGLTVAYVLNVRWVFHHRRFGQRGWLELLIFNAIVLTGLAISEAAMAALVAGAGIHYLQAKVLTSLLVMVFNFVAKKLILFSGTPAAGDARLD